MKNINDILPKFPNMKWGVLTNWKPTISEIKQLDKILPSDGSWHTIFSDNIGTIIDGMEIRRDSVESMR